MKSLLNALASALLSVAAMVTPASSVPSDPGLQINPQEIGLLIESYLADQDATIIGLMTVVDGSPHTGMSTQYRAAHIGPHAEALPTVDLADREEWLAWRGEQRATVGSDDYVILYNGYMFDTRELATDDQTYEIRWESTWYKNDPSQTTPFAEGGGVFLFDDPDLSFEVTVDPLNPSEVTLSAGASTTLWGVVDLSIEGSKNFGTGLLTAKLGAGVSIPGLSDYIGPLVSGDFTFEYNQKTGTYKSTINTFALGYHLTQDTVNKGKVKAPVVPSVPIMDFPEYIPPPYANAQAPAPGAPNVQNNGGLNAPDPEPIGPFLPGIGSTTIGPTAFEDPYNPYGDLANELLDLVPLNFNNPNQLVVHPGIPDPVTFPPPTDSASIPLGGALAFSYMDPLADPSDPPGIFLAPPRFIPEPGSIMLLSTAIVMIGAGRRRRAA